MSITLKAQPLTAAAIAPYVTLLGSEDGNARVIDEVMGKGDVSGAHAFTVMCPKPISGAIFIAALERHPHSTQSFVPIKVGRWLIMVAPTATDGSPDVSGAKAFLAGPEDAICIGQNVWHAGLTVLDRQAEFGMIMWKAESAEDGVLFELDVPIAVEI